MVGVYVHGYSSNSVLVFPHINAVTAPFTIDMYKIQTGNSAMSYTNSMSSSVQYMSYDRGKVLLRSVIKQKKFRICIKIIM